MNKQEYLSNLKLYLRKLPVKERQEAIEYFNEYFEDAGEGNEQEVIDELGSPKEAASELIKNLLVESTDQIVDNKSGFSWKAVMIAILAIFATPIGLPLFVCFIFLIGALIFLVLGALFAIVAIIGTGFILGGSILISGLTMIFESIPAVLLLSGGGLALIGISILMAIGLFYIIKFISYCFIMLAGKVIKRGGKVNEA